MGLMDSECCKDDRFALSGHGLQVVGREGEWVQGRKGRGWWLKYGRRYGSSGKGEKRRTRGIKELGEKRKLNEGWMYGRTR